ncbi:DUF3429 domain-containing protein [Aurantiacibacter poecillastricola]|uniref:DUF3429 domain-containing protein n=1 Tax=Aurantiacibacter poecillastricola TaxID=3064385 RepID=UPI00273F252B|nr:DUF3429 domain-containing protein [Aurantiacibacter sp. 219JJ12-13]MDP5263498.1 DUF3429 domain-containing protein [Aurantiacibacter sp. 219JJ12-13]
MKTTPPAARLLGFAGLLPQAACLVAAFAGPPEWRWSALAIGWAYAALILSFLGGAWWGLASGSPDGGRNAPAWLWISAVLPSLLALLTFLPWVFGAIWPGPSLFVLGGALVLSVLVDARLVTVRPSWWMRLRTPLSLGLGIATILLGFAA